MIDNDTLNLIDRLARVNITHETFQISEQAYKGIVEFHLEKLGPDKAFALICQEVHDIRKQEEDKANVFSESQSEQYLH
ncbi:hypothetical protein [Kiloniella sp. b19]|uniref:hypothetical protein n=1 Tax=Kiloniella sp. GXU_MW_B19 TaxID=3141326 RepID=UPI0031CE94BA